jgi:hypothetical protein
VARIGGSGITQDLHFDTDSGPLNANPRREIGGYASARARNSVG